MASWSYGGSSPARSGGAAAGLRGGVLVVVPGLHDVLADGPAGVEVGQLEVGVLRAELGADVVAGLAGQAADLAHHAAGLAGEVGEPVGTEDEHGHHADDQELGEPDPHHRRIIAQHPPPARVAQRLPAG